MFEPRSRARASGGTVVEPSVLAERRARRAGQPSAGHEPRAGALRLEHELCRRALRAAPPPAPAAGDRAPQAAELARALLRAEARVAAAQARADGLAAELRRRAAAHQRAEQAVAALRGQVAEVRSLAARSPAGEPGLRELSAAAGAALDEAERRIEAARATATQVAERLDREAAVRAQQVEAATSSLRAERRARRAPAAPWLPRALARLAVEDPGTAARLGAQLLEAQGLDETARLDYDLELPRLGWHLVTLEGGRAAVTRVRRPRRRRHSDFRLSLDAPALAELLAHGGSPAVRRAGRARVRGTLRRHRALRSVPPAQLDLAALAGAGIWPDPGLVLDALTRLIEPAWTSGPAFAVALHVDGGRGGRWTVRAGEGPGRPEVVAGAPAAPGASVRLNQEAFQRLLAGESALPGAKAVVRGDVAVLRRLVEWVERAQREPA
jgi:hypothetical protein